MMATSRDLLPGPVNILVRRSRRFVRDALTPRASVVVNATMGSAFRGRRVAEAMVC